MLRKNFLAIKQEDKLNEECGVFGVFNVKNAAKIAYYGLHALQHRGQESSGMIVNDGSSLNLYKSLGLAKDVFTDEVISNLQGNTAISHVRYATGNNPGIINAQPFFFKHSTGDFGLCHNGNIVNAHELRLDLEKNGSLFQSSSDSEILAHLIKKDFKKSLIDSIKESLQLLEGAFAFLIITNDKLYACRDKNGLRPLSLGTLEKGYVLSSETCAFDMIGAEFIKDVLPGEILTISKDGITSDYYTFDTKQSLCAMEFIYFSRPDSNLEGTNVHLVRQECGKILAKESYIDADIVVGVPESSLMAASGYSQESGIPYDVGLVKNRYIARTFIEPTQALREFGVKMKLLPVKSIISGKKVVLVDDSIVRGTTAKQIVGMLKSMGAKEVHMRVAAPAIIAPCFYGVATSTYEELISAKLTKEEVSKVLGVDSLEFLSISGLQEACQNNGLCLACFNNEYPTHLYSNFKNKKNDEETLGE